MAVVQPSRRLFVSVIVGMTGLAWLASGCGKDVRTASSDDLIAMLDTDSGSDRVAATQRLTSQGESVIPRILEAFPKAETKPHVQMAMADAVFRMPPSSATAAALEKMAEQTTDLNTRARITGFASQRRLGH